MSPARLAVAWVALTTAACRRDPVEPVLPVPDTGFETTTTLPIGVEDLVLAVDPDMVLMIHATFTDPGGTEAWVEYRFEGDDWLVAPLVSPGNAVILGIPAYTLVEARAVAVVDGQTVYSKRKRATTGPPPLGIRLPSVTTYEPSLASPAQWAMTSVASGNFTYEGPYWVEIYDRRGRLVWYRQVPDRMFSFYPSIARDGTHVWFDAENIFGLAFGDPHVTRLTLDGRWQQIIAAPGAGQAFAEGPDGAFFYELRDGAHGINRLDPSGATALVWDCDAHMVAIGARTGDCLLNACNWDPARNTLLASQFPSGTVFEVDLATNQAVRQMGQIDVGDPYAFDPPSSGFAYQHWPHWTAEGTLMVSTHAPCSGGFGCDPVEGQYGRQIAAEYAVDDATKTLTLIWSHESTDRWATQIGEAYRLPNGNVLQGYGQDGAAREITADGRTAWDVSWPRDNSGYRVVGHTSLIDDLYALNAGPSPGL